MQECLAFLDDHRMNCLPQRRVILRYSGLCSKKMVKLLPGPKSRRVSIYDGYLWAGPNKALQPTGSADG